MAVDGSPFAAGKGAWGIAGDPAGRLFLSPTMEAATYPRTKWYPGTGRSCRWKALLCRGSNPTGVAVDPTGRFVHEANNGSNNVSLFVVSPSSGALTAVKTAVTEAGLYPADVAADTGGEVRLRRQ